MLVLQQHALIGEWIPSLGLRLQNFSKADARVSGHLIWTCILRRDESPSGGVSFSTLMTEGTQRSSTDDMSVFQTANVKEDESHSE